MKHEKRKKIKALFKALLKDYVFISNRIFPITRNNDGINRYYIIFKVSHRNSFSQKIKNKALPVSKKDFDHLA